MQLPEKRSPHLQHDVGETHFENTARDAFESRLAGLGIDGKVLFLAGDDDSKLELAARNNPRMTVVKALGASVVDLLNHEKIVASEAALVSLTEVLSK